MKSMFVSFVAGIIFALGLGVGGMTQPAKVVGFLDFTGNWDPSLAFVMIGAIVVYSVSYWVLARHCSLVSTTNLPASARLDSRLIGGSAIFGVGWGLAGICPGPAMTGVASGNISFLIFTAAMIAGMAAFELMSMVPQRRTTKITGEFVQDM